VGSFKVNFCGKFCSLSVPTAGIEVEVSKDCGMRIDEAGIGIEDAGGSEDAGGRTDVRGDPAGRPNVDEEAIA
jgi:hypothetical protein